VSRRALLVTGLLVALLLAGGVSYFASSDPDGLTKVAADQGSYVLELHGIPLPGQGTRILAANAAAGNARRAARV